MEKILSKIKNNYKALAIIFLIGFILRLFFFNGILIRYGETGFYPKINEDAGQYLSIAKNIIDYGIFSRDTGTLKTIEIFRTPGYPLFIATILIIFKSLSLVILLQNILWFFAIWYLYKIVMLLFDNKKIALIASIFLVFDPTIIYWNSQLTSETLFTFLLLVSVYYLLFFLKNKYNNLLYLAISAFAFGWANITRPIGQYLIIIFIFVLIFFGIKKYAGRVILSVLLFCLIAQVVALPLIVRNKVLYNSYELSWVSAVGFGKYLSAIDKETDKDLLKDIKITDNIYERAQSIKEETIKAIKAYPLIFLKIHILAIAPFFIGDGYINSLSTIFPDAFANKINTDWQGSTGEFLSFLGGRSGLNFIIFWLGKVVWSLIFILSLLGVYLIIKKEKDKWAYVLFLVLIIYYFFLASGVGGYSRFRFPVNPLIFIFLAYTLNYAITCYNTKSR